LQSHAIRITFQTHFRCQSRRPRSDQRGGRALFRRILFLLFIVVFFFSFASNPYLADTNCLWAVILRHLTPRPSFFLEPQMASFISFHLQFPANLGKLHQTRVTLVCAFSFPFFVPGFEKFFIRPLLRSLPIRIFIPPFFKARCALMRGPHSRGGVFPSLLRSRSARHQFIEIRNCLSFTPPSC